MKTYMIRFKLAVNQSFLKGAEVMHYQEEGNFAKGMVWGVSLSIPLWIALFGWAKIVMSIVT